MSASAPASPELAGDLWHFVESTAGSRGFQFTPQCSSEVKALILAGVGRLVQDGTLDNPAVIANARGSLERLVSKMIEHAIEQRKGQIIKGTEATSTRMLHEYNFFSVRSWFCPCYPWC
jgi:hypothetical protein